MPLKRVIAIKKLISIFASVTHGSSGGVLSDRHGNVMGVVTLGYDNGINGALKYAFFKHLVEGFTA